MRWCVNLCVLSVFVLFSLCFDPSEAQKKFKICVVEKFNSNKKSIYCDSLRVEESEAECIMGYSRLDCLRQIWKGKADFGAFEAEDLVAVANLKIDDVAVINTIRIFPELPYQTQIAAVVRKNINITNLTDLRGHKLCHPGYGLKPSDWTNVMARFLESTVVPQSCDPELSVVENRLNSSSQYFKSACQAGPWVQDIQMDLKLKQKYFNLCELCDEPESCSNMDKYYGNTGSLYCLTDGIGDIAWARLVDIDFHFGIHSHVIPIPEASNYELLCPDGGREPLDTPEHCTWLSRPWPVVVSRKKHSQSIQKLVSSLKASQSHSWQWALRHLLESFSQAILPLDRIVSPDDYLRQAPGFISAISMTPCNPPRVITMCTKTNAEFGKCNLLKEAATAYGIEPTLICTRSDTAEECVRSVQNGTADMTVTEPQQEQLLHEKHSLDPILFEFTTNISNLYKLSAVVRNDSQIKSLADLKGKKACFAGYDSIGWTTVVYLLKKHGLISKTCPYSNAVGEFFSEACVPGIESSTNTALNLQSLCEGNKTYISELEAYKCLAVGKGDVAFIDMKTVRDNTENKYNAPWALNIRTSEFRSLCVNNETSNCYLSWATPGQLIVKSDISNVKQEDISFALLEMGNLFGKHMKASPGSFLIFAPYDDQENVLFHDFSENLVNFESLKNLRSMRHNYNEVMKKLIPCSSAAHLQTSVIFVSSILMAVTVYLS